MGSKEITKAKEQHPILALLDQNKDKLNAVATKTLNAERMIRVVAGSLARTPKLANCEPWSVVIAVSKAMQLGLEPSGLSGQAYLVPFWNKNTSRDEAQLIVGYKGMIDMARRSGHVSTIHSTLVYEGEHFKETGGIDPMIEHEIDRSKNVSRSEEDIIAAYAVAKFKDGGYQFEVMSREEIDGIKNMSQAGRKDYGPWAEHYGQMARKTVIRRLCNYLPMSPEDMRIVGQLDEVEAGRVTMTQTDELGIIDVPAIETPKSKGDAIVASLEKPQEAQHGEPEPDASESADEPETQEDPEEDEQEAPEPGDDVEEENEAPDEKPRRTPGRRPARWDSQFKKAIEDPMYEDTSDSPYFHIRRTYTMVFEAKERDGEMHASSGALAEIDEYVKANFNTEKPLSKNNARLVRMHFRDKYGEEE